MTATDSQFALKQAIDLALHNDETDADKVVQNAQKFLGFLVGGPARTLAENAPTPSSVVTSPGAVASPEDVSEEPA